MILCTAEHMEKKKKTITNYLVQLDVAGPWTTKGSRKGIRNGNGRNRSERNGLMMLTSCELCFWERSSYELKVLMTVEIRKCSNYIFVFFLIMHWIVPFISLNCSLPCYNKNIAGRKLLKGYIIWKKCYRSKCQITKTLIFWYVQNTRKGDTDLEERYGIMLAPEHEAGEHVNLTTEDSLQVWSENSLAHSLQDQRNCMK